jgi:hypothetical protein
MIALMGLDAETGVFMLLFLDLSHEYKKGILKTEPDLVEAIVHSAVKRVRPKAMTVARDAGLAPDHVVDRDRRRRHETHRGADGGRPGDELPPGVSCTRRSTISGRTRAAPRGVALGGPTKPDARRTEPQRGLRPERRTRREPPPL